MTPLRRRYLRSLLGYHDDDLQDTVPDDIHVTYLIDGWYYLTATYGTGNDHQHVEIKLDQARLGQLLSQVSRVANTVEFQQRENGK